MKKGVKIFIIVLVLILVAAAITAFLLFRYYPHYKAKKKPAQFTDIKEVDEPIRVMSANLRCINPLDTGKKSWFYRADLIIKNIGNNKPSIIGFQEATKWQYAYLKDCLTDFDSVITYRDESTFSEGCPIFYRTDMYDLVDKGSFWLSETPEVMSKDWNSKCYRICSYVILKEKSTEKEFVVFNTHLDHVSDEARINGIGVVLDKISQFGSLPSMIMGDFNAEEGSVTYENVTKDFLDARYQVDNAVDSCTYQNFGKELDRNRIDYFMISKTGINVKSYKVVTDTFDGVYPSDHFPLLAEFTLE
mgnify:FL=1